MTRQLVVDVVERGPRDRAQFAVLVAIASFAGTDNTCFPGTAKIAGRARMSERAVQRAIPELVREGWLTVDECRGGRGCVSGFTVLPIPGTTTGKQPAETPSPTTPNPVTVAPETPSSRPETPTSQRETPSPATSAPYIEPSLEPKPLENGVGSVRAVATELATAWRDSRNPKPLASLDDGIRVVSKYLANGRSRTEVEAAMANSSVLTFRGLDRAFDALAKPATRTTVTDESRDVIANYRKERVTG